MAAVADIIAEVQEGNLTKHRLAITPKPKSLLPNDLVVVTVAMKQKSVLLAAVGTVQSGNGSSKNRYQIRFDDRIVTLSASEVEKHLIKVTERRI